MSTVATTRWQLVSEPPEEARCIFCETDGPLVDTGLELDGERRLYVCAECITGLARTARVGSKAATELRHEFEAEIAERDARLSALAGQLTAAEKTIKEQREEIAGRGEALDRARVFASRAVSELQQIA